MQTFLKGKRVGYWLSDKKMKKLNFVAFVDMCRKRGIEMVQLDLSQPLEEQGPLDVIIHKLTDLILEAEKNDTQALLLVQCVQDYIEAHPETIVLDPLPAIRTLLDRWRSYQLIHRIESCMQDNRICSPPFMVLNSEYGPDTMKQIEKHGITLPFICKTRVAHGTSSHEMALIFSEEDLKDVKPPCVIQSFINHNAVLYKVFVVGESYTVVERPSLKNFPSGPAEREAIFFNSHNVSKPECSSDLTSTVNYITTMPFNESSPPISSQHKYWEKRDNVEGVFQLPSHDVIRELSKALRQALGVSLFGIDVIISNQTGQHAVIDINAFPGYEGVPEFFTDLLNHITSLLQDPVPESAPSGQHRDSEAGQTPATAVPSAGHQDSSGILGKDGSRTVENEAAKKAQGQRRGCNSALSANFQPHCLCPRATKASSQ